MLQRCTFLEDKNYLLFIENSKGGNTILNSLLRKMLSLIKKKSMYVLLKLIYGHHNIKNNKIIFDNFLGKGYGDNPKYICEELLHLNADIDIVWVVNDSNYKFPDRIRTVKYNSFKSLYEYYTAKIWVDNVRNSFKPPKREGQFYLQTWHGPFSPKKIERDAENNLPKQYIECAKNDGMIMNALLSNSELLDEQYYRTFWLSPNVEILKSGLPRNDIYFHEAAHEDIKNIVRIRYNFSSNDYIVLYAPTFRDDGSKRGYDIPYEKIRNEFEAKTNKHCKMLIRFHPNVGDEMVVGYSNDIINVTDYPNLQDLVIVSDAIISDYSTTIFDFSLMKKPAFIHAIDIEEYGKLRGLLPEFYMLPFPHTYTNNELLSAISSFSCEDYVNGLDEFYKKHPIYDTGIASKTAAKWIVDKMKSKS